MQLGVDVGGTFTDFVYLTDEGEIVDFKVPSVPVEPAEAIEHGLAELRLSFTGFLHGTTVATNTILQRTGSKTAFITTAGFGSMLHIGRQTRPSLYDFKIVKKEPLVPLSLCFELEERISSDGKVITPLKAEHIKTLASRLKRSGVESAAVCLLHSYQNPVHEQMVGRYLRKQLKIPVSLSSEILPEFREYERASTTVINAYLLSPVGNYIKKLNRIIRKHGLSEYFVMQSSGGIAESKLIRSIPARTLLSGPAAGVAASAHLGEELGERNLITFDMGGTSADVAAIVDSKIVWTPHGEIDSLPLKTPMVEIVTIGAGGGSIAWNDEGGALRVGPRSAGADPGPVCYGKGGRNITVTDADLLMGIIDPLFFLGGRFPLDVALTRRAAEKFAGKLNYSVEEMAEGVVRVVEANMLRAVKRVSTEKGLTPNKFGLIAFGGAGPIHAPGIARELGISKIVVPKSPGTFSAFGLLVSDLKFDYTRTHLCSLRDKTAQKRIESILLKHKTAAKQILKSQDIPVAKAIFDPTLDLRYKGQSHEVNVPLKNSIDSTEREFHTSHNNMYGYFMAGAAVELVNVRLTVRVPRTNDIYSSAKKNKKGKRGRINKPKAGKILSIVSNGTRLKTPFYNRFNLKPGMEMAGPAVIADTGSTVLVPEDMLVEVDFMENLIMIFK